MLLARGCAGALCAGYHLAARLGRWEIEMPDDRLADGRWSCTAEVLARDPFWLEHAERFTLRLQVGRFTWRWHEVDVSVGDGLIMRGVGRPEVV